MPDHNVNLKKTATTGNIGASMLLAKGGANEELYKHPTTSAGFPFLQDLVPKLHGKGRFAWGSGATPSAPPLGNRILAERLLF